MSEFENEVNSFKVLEKKIKEYKHLSEAISSTPIINISNCPHTAITTNKKKYLTTNKDTNSSLSSNISSTPRDTILQDDDVKIDLSSSSSISNSNITSETADSLDNLTNNNSHLIAYKKSSLLLFQEEKELFGFHGYEGLYLIRNALPNWLQVELAYLALAECPEPPNTTSLGLVEV